jgi:hypothetical protein
VIDLADFWLGVVVACLAWYLTVTIYVAVRGALDIKHMLARLDRMRASEDEGQD